MQELKVTLTGTAPLIVHNGEMSNPLSKPAKQLKLLTSKKKKTDVDLMEIARVEWGAGFYLNDDEEIIMPGDVLHAMLISGAKKDRCGAQAKSSVQIYDDPRIEFDGMDLSRDELWDRDQNTFLKMVKVGQSKVPRCRPIFHDWQITFSIHYFEDLVDERTLIGWLDKAGREVGLCDWRPKFGRFEAELVEEAVTA